MTTGLNIEQQDDPTPPVTDPNNPNPPAQEDDEPIVAEKNAKGEDVVSVAALIHQRKEAKAAKKEAAEAKAKLDHLASQIESWAPIVQKIKEDPSIITRVANPRPREEPQRDIEAEELAEDLGLIAADGSLDVNRARKHLDRQAARLTRLVDSRVAPVANATASQIAEARRIQAHQARTKGGELIATQESIDEAFRMLPPELSANPEVARLLPILGAGLDRFHGRTPQERRQVDYDDPILALPMGGRRGGGLTEQDKQLAQTTGVGEKWLSEKTNQLATNGRKGVALE